ncbi:MAG: hypothetical protein JW889_05000, partial [Verrucomicrobia bacterium]|nr:hypothetical protein [Verrucomicrobiota bacterium]
MCNGDGDTGGDSEVQYVYDDYGRLETKRVRTASGDPGTWIETDYDYYPDGSTWKVTDARDVTVEYKSYDDNAVYAGRLREIDFPSDSDITYTYNSTTGRLQQVAQGALDVEYTYDSFGRLASLTDVWGKTINIDAYNESGKITAWRYPGYDAGYDIDYAYDDVGRLTTITDNMPASGSKVTAIDYDQDTGAMVKVTLPNGTVTTLEYDDLGRLTNLVNAKSLGGPVITSYAYHYDEDAISGGLGLVDQINHEDGRFDQFSYDAHERLTTEHYKAQDGSTYYRFDYAYDNDGNRTEKKYDYDPQAGTTKIVWFSDETDRTTVDDDFGPSNQLKRMWTQGTNTTGTKHTV